MTSRCLGTVALMVLTALVCLSAAPAFADNPRMLLRVPPNEPWPENEVPYTVNGNLDLYWDGIQFVAEECIGCPLVNVYEFSYPVDVPVEQQRQLFIPSLLFFAAFLYQDSGVSPQREIGAYVAEHMLSDPDIDIRVGADTNSDGTIDEYFPGPFEQPIPVVKDSMGTVKGSFGRRE